jgi:hypothetical protein|tara:strand:- start:23 stop:160 length:138 start_codon:yes stop_codon:yes gene_type:complete
MVEVVQVGMVKLALLELLTLVVAEVDQVVKLEEVATLEPQVALES